MNGLFWNVVHSIYITLWLFIIDYRINILEDIDKIIPVIGKTWWTNFENQTTVGFYKLHQNILLYGENLLDENYLCAILQGDWKWMEVFSWMNRWQEYHINELNQEFQPSVEKQLATMPIIYDSQCWNHAKT